LHERAAYCTILHINANIFMHTTFMRTITQLAYSITETLFLLYFDVYAQR